MPTERETEITELWADVTMPVQNVILNANLAAREIARHRDRASWLEVGRGLSEIRAEAQRRAGIENSLQHPRYRRFKALLMTKAPDLAALEEHDRAGCQHSIWMFEKWDVVEPWLATLKPTESKHLNHPSAIRRRFDAASKPKPQRAEQPPQPAPQKATLVTLKEKIGAKSEEAEARIRELEEALNAAQVKISNLETLVRSGRPMMPATVKAIRQLRALVHPDKAPPEAKEWAHSVFTKIDPILEREMTRDKDTWMSDEDMMRRRQATQAANSRRAKEAHARKKAAQAGAANVA